jgi:hypothetical protein
MDSRVVAMEGRRPLKGFTIGQSRKLKFFAIKLTDI